MAEEWRYVDGTVQRYEVSNTGKVRSVARLYKGGGKLIPSKELHQDNRKGYRYVTMYLGVGHTWCCSVHTLVAKAFPEICGEWFEGCEVHHKDADPSNNCAENLVCLSKEEHHKQRNVDYKWTAKRVFKYDLDWNLVEVLSSLSEGYSRYCRDTVLCYIKQVKPYKGFYLVFDD